MSTYFDRFILKFNKMALILPQVPPVFGEMDEISDKKTYPK